MKRLLFIVALACMWAEPAGAQDFQSSYNFVFAGTAGPGHTFANTGISSFSIAWNVAGQISSCAVQVDSSPDGVTWGSGDLIASQNCLTAGSSSTAPVALGKNFVRVNVTALSSPGNSNSGNASLNVTLNGWGGSGNSGNVIDAAAQFGVKADGIQVVDGTATSGQPAVSSNSANWSSATDVGKLFWVFPNGGCVTDGAQSSSTNQVASGVTIASVQGPHNATLSGNVTTGGSNMCFAWATDSDPQLAALDTYLLNLSAGAQCPDVELPAGGIGVDSDHLYMQPTPCQNNPDVSGGSVMGGGMKVHGKGFGVTDFWLSAKWWATWGTHSVHGPTSTIAWYVPPSAHWSNVRINGLGESRSTSSDTANHVILGVGSYALLDHVRCTQAGWLDGNSIFGQYGLPAPASTTGGEIFLSYYGNDGCGSENGGNGVGSSYNGTIFADHSSFQDNCGAGLILTSTQGILFDSQSSYYLSRDCSGSGFLITENFGGTFRSHHDVWMTQSTSANTLFYNRNNSPCGPAYIEGGHIGVSNTNTANATQTGSIAIKQDSGCVLYLKDSFVNAGAQTSGNGATTLSNSGTIYDQGGNSIMCTSGCTFGTIIPVNGGSMANAVAIASRNTTLTSQNLLGWVDYASTTHTTAMYPAALRVSVAASESAVGSGGTCSTNSVYTFSFAYTDQTSTAQTVTLGTMTITGAGTVGGSVTNLSQPINVAFASTIQMTVTETTSGNCTTQPSWSGTFSLGS